MQFIIDLFCIVWIDPVSKPTCYYNLTKVATYEIGVNKVFEIKGFDELGKTLNELQKLTNELDGELGVIQYDPESAESIELAIVEMERMVDKKFENYATNAVARNMADGIKQAYRQMILDKASEARVNRENEEDGNGS